MKNMADQIIYILTNAAMPDYVKIGRTTNLTRRLKSLYTTPVPLPFEVFYAVTVEDAQSVEKWLFEIFDDRRESKKREFFQIAPERVAVALREKKIQDVTPGQPYTESAEDKVALEKARERRSNFNFKMVDIPVGAELYFTRDENVKVKVVDDRNIEYKGEVTSLSSAAKELLGNEYGVAGPQYWMYEGETLSERRRRMEIGE